MGSVNQGIHLWRSFSFVFLLCWAIIRVEVAFYIHPFCTRAIYREFQDSRCMRVVGRFGMARRKARDGTHCQGAPLDTARGSCRLSQRMVRHHNSYFFSFRRSLVINLCLCLLRLCLCSLIRLCDTFTLLLGFDSLMRWALTVEGRAFGIPYLGGTHSVAEPTRTMSDQREV